MTGLHRTDLTTPQKIECAAYILARQGEHGSVTALSEAFGLSRPTIYATGDAAHEVLTRHFEDTANGTVRVEVDEAQLQRAIVALRAMAPNAIRAIEDLIPLLYPGVRVSFGKIQGILCEAEERAARFNAQADLSNIDASALDEMFSQGDPVLAGVDLDYGYLHSLALRETRSAQDWADVLNQGKAQGLDLGVVVKDAAQGIAAGVSEAFPDAQQRDDCFHVLYEMNKVRRRLERRAYGALQNEEDAKAKLSRIRVKEKKQRAKQKSTISRAKCHSEEAIDRYDRFDCAYRQVRDALEPVDRKTGQLRTGDQAQAQFTQAAAAIQAIDDYHCAKIAGYLRNRAPGLSLATRALHNELSHLSATYPIAAVFLATLIWCLVSDIKRHRRPRQHMAMTRQLAGAFAQLNQLLGSQTDELLDTVKHLLDHRHRASSAIEGFNAALRPFLYVHKGVSQSFLELFRARYNLRTRRWGRHKGTSAHECLTGQPVSDWLSLIGYPPKTPLH